MIKKASLTILFLSLSFPQLFAQMITFEVFLKQVLDKHPQLEIYTLSEEAAKIKSDNILAQDKWLYSLKPFVNYYGETAAAAYKSDSSTIFGSDFSLSTPFGLSGGEGGVSVTSAREIHDPTSLEQQEGLYRQSFSVFYKQSLLQNRGLREQKLLHEASVKDLEINYLNNRELVEKLLLEFSLDYLNWVYLEDVAQLLRQRVVYSEDLLKQVELRFRNNLVDELDVLRSRESLLNSRQSLVQADYQLERLKNRLNEQFALGITKTSKPDMNFLNIDSASEKSITYDSLLLTRSFRILELEKEKITLNRKRLVYLQDPDLNLNVNIGVAGKEINFSDSLSNMTPVASLSLVLSGAANQSSIENQLAENSLLSEKTIAEKDNLLFKLDALRNTLITQLVQDRDFIRNQDELVKIAKQKTEEEKKYYNQGRGQLIYIIQSLDNETLQQLKKLERLFSYQKTRMQALELIDSFHIFQEGKR